MFILKAYPAAAQRIPGRYLALIEGFSAGALAAVVAVALTLPFSGAEGGVEKSAKNLDVRQANHAVRCADQQWPYISADCLTSARGGRVTAPAYVISLDGKQAMQKGWSTAPRRQVAQADSQ